SQLGEDVAFLNLPIEQRKRRRCAQMQGDPRRRLRASLAKSMLHREPSLVVIAVDLLEEGFGVECARAAGNAGDDRKRNKGGQDGLHGYSSPLSVPNPR